MRALPVFAIFLFLLVGMALADTGPKPTAAINVYYNGDQISGNFSAVMLHCTNSTYSYRNPPPHLNISEYDSGKGCYWTYASFAWGGQCTDSRCGFSYSIPTEFKLAVYLPSLGRVFITNATTRTSFDSEYTAYLSSSGSAVISENTPFPAPLPLLYLFFSFIVALVATLFIELPVAFVFLKISKLKTKILLYVLLANLISLPIVWGAVIFFIGDFVLALAFAELFAMLFEGYFIHFTNKRLITLKKSLLMSLMMNISSLVAGGILLLVLM